MYDLERLEWVGESSLGQYYEPLCLFFHNVWTKPYDYIVLNARRCYNLNCIFQEAYEAAGGVVENKNRIISNNALLLYAKEIAEYYCARNRFPLTLLVDDLILHGRGISKILSDLEGLIVRELSNLLGDLSADDRYYIHRNLSAAVNIYAFAVDMRPLLLEDIYLEQLQWEKRLYSQQMRRLSRQISGFIQKAHVPNTSYVLSCKTAVAAIPSSFGNWVSQPWSYSGTEQRVFMELEPPAETVNFLPTVRLWEDASQKTMWLTSLVLFGELSKEQLAAVCAAVDAALGTLTLPWTRYILRQEYPLLQRQRAQFISFLLSAMYLLRFLRDSSHPISPAFLFANSDVDKIARNFGKADVVLDEFRTIISDGAPQILQELHTILHDSLWRDAAAFSHEPFLPLDVREHCEHLKEQCSYVNTHIEDVCNTIGISAEISAYREVASNHRQADSCKVGTISMDTLLSWNVPDLYFECPVERECEKRFAKVPQRLSSMLILMDNGKMSMNYTCKERSGEWVVGCELKAGELATFSIPHRLHMLIPALALVESESWRLELEPKDAVKQFITLISDGSTVGSEESQRKEYAAVLFLKTQGGRFIDLLYECGQTISSWEIDLITPEDWREEGGKGDYLSFTRQKEQIQEFYLVQARCFLQLA